MCYRQANGRFVFHDQHAAFRVIGYRDCCRKLGLGSTRRPKADRRSSAGHTVNQHVAPALPCKAPDCETACKSFQILSAPLRVDRIKLLF
jgi:hypothetical protein